MKSGEELLLKANTQLSELYTQFEHEIELLTESSMTLDYPILTYPDKLKAFSLDQNPNIIGKLLGIKGQYLLLDVGVINIRKHGGYRIKVNFD